MDFNPGDFVTLDTPDGPAEVEIVGGDKERVTLRLGGREQVFRRSVLDNALRRQNTPEATTGTRQPPAPRTGQDQWLRTPGSRRSDSERPVIEQSAGVAMGAVRDTPPAGRAGPQRVSAGGSESRPRTTNAIPRLAQKEPQPGPRGPVADASAGIESAAGRRANPSEPQIMPPRQMTGVPRVARPGPMPQPADTEGGPVPGAVRSTRPMPPQAPADVTSGDLTVPGFAQMAGPGGYDDGAMRGRNRGEPQPEVMAGRPDMPPPRGAPQTPEVAAGPDRRPAAQDRAAKPTMPEQTEVVEKTVETGSGDAGSVLAAGAQSLGAVRPDGKAKTETQQKRETRQIEKTYLESWTDNALPGIVEGLVGRGMLEEAERVMQFGAQADFKSGVERYAGAALAAARGDMDTFADQMTLLFDDEKYNPDGYTVDRENSSWIRDEDGEVTGAEITFMSEDGEVVTERWDDWESMVTSMLTAMSPESALQRYLDSADAARSARADYARGEADFGDFVRREVVKAGLRDDNSAESDVDDALNTLSKDPAFGAMTQEEKLQAVMEMLDTRDVAVSVRESGGATRPAAPTPPPLRY